MASYPGSVKSFTTKNASDTIEASHPNDIQDEVAAIEGGLINGISHDLSPSTTSTRSLGTTSKKWKNIVADSLAVDRVVSTSMEVSGNSTLGATVISDLTVTNLQVNGGSSGIASAATESARVYQSSNGTVANGSVYIFSYNDQVHVSTSTWHSTTTNPSRLTVPSSGVYLFSGNAQASFSAPKGSISLQILLDSTIVIAEDRKWESSVFIAHTEDLDVSAIYNMGSTQFVEMRVVNSVGTTSTLVANSSWAPSFSGVKL